MSSSSSITRTRGSLIRLSYRPAATIATPRAEGRCVARILIHEPHPDVRVLLAAVVRRAGHDPVGQGELAGDDTPELMILEPASADGLAAAARLRRGLEDLPIICTSIEPPTRATKALAPVAHLVKPFRLGELEAAIASALAA
jgi:DNA-binding response OmpR family regulator